MYRNYSSVLEHQTFVKDKIISDIKLGCVKGPYLQPFFSNVVPSPLGLFQRNLKIAFASFMTGHLQRILNLSTQPFENSTVTLESFDGVANIVLSAGKTGLIAKADIEKVFKNYTNFTIRLSQTWFQFQQLHIF